MRTHLVDSNVILRFLTNEPKPQAYRASKFFQQCEQGEIALRFSTMVIAEVVFVLTGEAHKIPREVVAEQLKVFLSTPSFEVQEFEAILYALELFSEGSIDFVDAYLMASSELSDYSLTSFDEDLGRSRDLSLSRFPKIRPIRSDS